MATSRRTAFARILFIGGLVIGINGSSAGSAFAATTSSSEGGIVTITTDGTVAVICESETGVLLVNGADVDTGFTFCNETSSIRVIGDAAVNTIDLSGVSAVELMNGATTEVQGNAGADVITGTDMPDHISGGIGADVISAGGGDDIIKGGIGADDITGGTGNDILMERADVDFTLTDTSLTGLGADVLISIEGAKLAGGSSNNTIVATAFTGSTILSGGRGNDVLTGGSGDDLLRADSGNDTLTGAGGADRLYAGTGDDQLHADDGLGIDWVVGERGSDTCLTDLGDTVWGCEIELG